MNTTYKKITLDYLIRVIRAINQGEKLEFSTAPYDGGLNYTILHTTILNEDYVAVVAPSICEKAFLVYGPDICSPFWEDDFKDLLMSLPLELGLDEDGCPYVKTEELERLLELHPELEPSDKDAWGWYDDDENNAPEEETTNPQENVLLPGIFTVNGEGKKVRFTRGNLMANVNAKGTQVMEWKPAKNQYDTVGPLHSRRTCKGGWMDLFGWTSANKDSDDSKRYGINTSEDDRDYDTGGTFCKWDSLLEQKLSMLSETEWEYLLDHALAKNLSDEYDFLIAGQRCAVLKPDGYTGTVADSYTEKEWKKAEEDGLVALPFAGYRKGTKIYEHNTVAEYWTHSPNEDTHCVYINANYKNAHSKPIRHIGRAVRLVSVI